MVVSVAMAFFRILSCLIILAFSGEIVLESAESLPMDCDIKGETSSIFIAQRNNWPEIPRVQ